MSPCACPDLICPHYTPADSAANRLGSYHDAIVAMRALVEAAKRATELEQQEAA